MRYSRFKDPWFAKRTWAEISKSALINNWNVIRSYISDDHVRVAAVVKANAYGHCADLVAPILEDAGCSFFFVATIDEAIFLRQNGIRSDILIFGTTKEAHTEYLKRYKLTQSIVTLQEIEGFAKASAKVGGPPLQVHMKLDTGMTRLGLLADPKHRERAVEALLNIAAQPSLKLTGVYSHLACADSDPKYNQMQRERFIMTVAEARRRGLPPVTMHLGASSAIPNQPDFHFDMVRPGIVLYGGRASTTTEHGWEGLRPVMTVKSVIEQVGAIEAGTRVSYGGTWTTPRDSVLAVVNMGYGDGLSRLLSNKGSFLHKGRVCPIRGRVCMDRCIIDVTGLDDVHVGDEVMLFGEDEYARRDASELADLYGTIDYEMFCNIQERVPRMLVE